LAQGRLACEFALVRYVPDVVKGEFTNIGVVLREAGPARDTQAAAVAVRFTRDWSRVRCMDAEADISLLEALEGEIAARLRAEADAARSLDAAASTSLYPKPVIAMIGDSFSNSLQMTEARGCLAQNLATELDLLMKMYVEPLKVKQDRRRTGRAALTAAMRSQFERAGVWGMMRKRIAASLYTRPGDPMKIDCGYRAEGVAGDLPGAGPAGEGAGGIVRMFHAVSLEADLEAAKVLAWSAPRLQEGVERVEGARLELTAVIEPLQANAKDQDGAEADAEPESAERYRFGVETMESQQIRVLTIHDLARAAQTARLELRL
jgi:hypothetical protein